MSTIMKIKLILFMESHKSNVHIQNLLAIKLFVGPSVKHDSLSMY